MIINNVGYGHRHDADFFIERENGSGDYLLLLLKTDAVFIVDGKEIKVPSDSVFIYPKGRPQYYKCEKGHVFENDWIHFDFSSAEEEREFLSMNIPLETPVHMDVRFLSYCIKSVSYEKYANGKYSTQSIDCFMKLIFIKISEMGISNSVKHDSRFDMLSTIRNKIYSNPYEQRNVEIAAHEIRMSRSAFQRAYKKMFGVTFIEDLNKSRISYAEMLLTTTSLSVEDISHMSGYKTYVHFIRCFRLKNNMTPSEYRKMHQKVI